MRQRFSAYTSPMAIGGRTYRIVDGERIEETRRPIITVVTSDIEDAGTDSTVEVRLNGTAGSSDFMILDSAKDNFERNSADTFTRPLTNLGTLESLDVHFISAGSQDKARGMAIRCAMHAVGFSGWLIRCGPLTGNCCRGV